MPNTTPPNEPRCSFGGKTETQANQLVSGPDGVHICDECIATCNEMMAQNAIEQVREDERLLTPQEIKARLDEYVIGQDEAKKILAVAVHNRYKRVFYADALKGDDGVELCCGGDGGGARAGTGAVRGRRRRRERWLEARRAGLFIRRDRKAGARIKETMAWLSPLTTPRFSG